MLVSPIILRRLALVVEDSLLSVLSKRLLNYIPDVSDTDAKSANTVTVCTDNFALCNLFFDLLQRISLPHICYVINLIIKMVEIHNIRRITYTAICTRLILCLNYQLPNGFSRSCNTYFCSLFIRIFILPIMFFDCNLFTLFALLMPFTIPST